MAIATYTSSAHGFGVTYDDALLTHVDDPRDPRLQAARSARIPTHVAAQVLFTTHGATAADIAAGRAPSQLITTDDTPTPARALATFDWDEVTLRWIAPFFSRTGVESMEASAMYWRGYPALVLSAVPPGDQVGSTSAPPAEVLVMLHTPQQIFSSLLTMPPADAELWGGAFQELIEGFFLLPLEREGRARTGLRMVRTLHVEARDLRDDLAAR